MPHTTSADGTRIAYTATGSGPALVLVDGALCHRAFGPSADLVKALAPDFTVYAYDRRGRGESGDTEPYSVDKEIDDLAAVIEAAGGEAALLGLSSGGVLALDAAHRLDSVTRVAVYECPFIVDGTHQPRPATLIDDMDSLIAQDKRGEAVTSFMRMVGTPGFAIAIMKLTPVWKKLKAVAPTIRYDYRVLGDTGRGAPLPADRWADVKSPVLAMDGGKSPDYLRNAMRMLADVLPNAEHRSLPGQTHMVKAAVLAPVVGQFLQRD
ncbi:alpha/beta fold hydrolase [Actinokineospora soli]|uniref:Alpha/beta fold hydrolase n=1 Tax=Actinokineospora soli TaxID=1048753 RepID=A0ABW2TRV1_9PSEU